MHQRIYRYRVVCVRAQIIIYIFMAFAHERNAILAVSVCAPLCAEYADKCVGAR